LEHSNAWQLDKNFEKGNLGQYKGTLGFFWERYTSQQAVQKVKTARAVC